ncbi:helix-turn-helix domain-containing protein [Dokdonella immobilis]|uniref:helix-turn-helix domain-containing protein n=1 Tax=Dokdonella immobilis TaxID=578942 RepID=UPI001C318F7F|nr:helix-turn-helix transcriptional regulator [Dokdonella immobilis]
MKDEITRLARRALKTELDTLRKAGAGYRHDIAALKRQVAALEKGRAALEKQAHKNAPTPSPSVNGEPAGKSLRFSAKRLRAQRKNIGFSAEDFARLLGVSAQSIYNWETGKAIPRRQQLEAIAALRGIGKREASSRLEANA